MLTALVLAPQENGTAPQEPGQTGAPSGGYSLLPFLLIGIVFWVVLIGPERKNRKKREAMLAQLQKGDKVVTTSGMHGTVAQVQDEVVTLQVADGVRLKFSRQAVQTVLGDGDENAKKAD